MPTNKTYHRKKRKPTSALTPKLLEILADPGDPEGLATLLARVGSDLFPYTLHKQDDAKRVLADLERLWNIHREDVLEVFVAAHPCERPGLHWFYDAPRPHIDPASGREGDHERYRVQRRAADVEYLRLNKLLTPAERKFLQTQKMEQ